MFLQGIKKQINKQTKNFKIGFWMERNPGEGDWNMSLQSNPLWHKNYFELEAIEKQYKRDSEEQNHSLSESKVTIYFNTIHIKQKMKVCKAW